MAFEAAHSAALLLRVLRPHRVGLWHHGEADGVAVHEELEAAEVRGRGACEICMNMGTISLGLILPSYHLRLDLFFLFFFTRPASLKRIKLG